MRWNSTQIALWLALRFPWLCVVNHCNMLTRTHSRRVLSKCLRVCTLIPLHLERPWMRACERGTSVKLYLPRKVTENKRRSHTTDFSCVRISRDVRRGTDPRDFVRSVIFE